MLSFSFLTGTAAGDSGWRGNRSGSSGRSKGEGFTDTVLILPPPLGCEALEGGAWASFISLPQCLGGALHTAGTQ